MDAVYTIAFYGGPKDGGVEDFVGLDMLGLPDARTVLTHRTDKWVHHYLVRPEEPYWGQTLRAEHVRISALPSEELDLSDLLGCPGTEG